VDAVDFPEIEQNRQRWPENLPMLPILIGKIANPLLPAIDIQGRGGQLETQAGRLHGQKDAKEGDRDTYERLHPKEGYRQQDKGDRQGKAGGQGNRRDRGIGWPGGRGASHGQSMMRKNRVSYPHCKGGQGKPWR